MLFFIPVFNIFLPAILFLANKYYQRANAGNAKTILRAYRGRLKHLLRTTIRKRTPYGLVDLRGT